MHMQAINSQCKIQKPNVTSALTAAEYTPSWSETLLVSLGNEFRCTTTLGVFSNCLPSSLDVFKGLTLGVSFLGSHTNVPVCI